MLKVKDILTSALNDVADYKTKKAFNDDFTELVDAIYGVFVHASSMNRTELKDYALPKSICDLINLRNVYFSKTSIGRKPYYQVSVNDGDVKLASPEELDHLIKRFNRDQKENYRLAVTPFVRTDYTLGDIPLFVEGEDVIEGFAVGETSASAIACQVLQIPFTSNGSGVKLAGASELEIMNWILPLN